MVITLRCVHVHIGGVLLSYSNLEAHVFGLADALVGRSSAGLSHQRRKHNLTASPTPDAAVATAATHDIGLPQEWTY